MVEETYQANGETVYRKENKHGILKDYVRVQISDTQTVTVKRRIRNPLTGRRHDLTKLSDDGYLRPFLAVQCRLKQNVVDLSRSPVICLDKEKWSVEERDGQYVATKREAESKFGERVLDDD